MTIRLKESGTTVSSSLQVVVDSSLIHAHGDSAEEAFANGAYCKIVEELASTFTVRVSGFCRECRLVDIVVEKEDPRVMEAEATTEPVYPVLLVQPSFNF